MPGTIEWHNISEEQRLERGALVVFETATIFIDGKGPFFYRERKTNDDGAAMKRWAEQKARDIARIQA